ncbi:unnamed protein product [Pieris macdunnoughi]|uniref:RRM domain-containing protein n=1 Tax=Pieris macdunnoughi TaxID=345717 RepID=A0A821W782_9NEOP|nr:unnamed protein product [Pieris macdunnoughi]
MIFRSYTEKKAREQKRRNKTLESRRALANVRVVQNNLVFVVGLPVRLADPEILKRQEYFGKYGKIHKVVINQSPAYAGSQSPSASAYVTYVLSADALRAIQGVNNVTLDGRVLKGSLGTTKYCANFMKNILTEEEPINNTTAVPSMPPAKKPDYVTRSGRRVRFPRHFYDL